MGAETDFYEEAEAGSDTQQRADVALRKIRAVVAGNGPDPRRNVSLVSYEEEILTFKAQTLFQPEVDMSSKVVPVVPPGALKMASLQEAEQRAKATAGQILQEPDVLSKLRQALEERPDKGLFCDRHVIPLDVTPALYTYDQPCPTCRGMKQSACRTCHGKGRVACVECKGQRHKTCPECRGAKTTLAAGGQSLCHNCQGQGKIQCLRCKGHGETHCIKCASSGKTNCVPCKASGQIHHLMTVKPDIRARFDYDKAKLPESAQKYIDQLGGKAIEQGHARMEAVTNVAARPPADGQPYSMLTMDYDISLPYGPLRFNVGAQEFGAHLFGYRSALVDMPPFLEQYLLGPLNLLNETAQGKGDPSRNLRDVMATTRAGRECVEGVVSIGARKTAEGLQQRYGLGLETQFIRKFVQTARAAVDRATIKPRLLGSIIGIGISVLFFLIYTFALSGLTGAPFPIRLISDLLAVIIGVSLPYLISQMMTRQSLMQLLGEPFNSPLRLASVGHKDLAGPIVAGIIFLLMCEFSFRMNPYAAPALYGLFRVWI